MIEEQIYYRLPEPLAIPDHVNGDEPAAAVSTWLRLTVAPCSTVAFARYQQYAREASAFCVDVLHLDTADESDDPVVRSQVYAAYARATMLATLLRLEIGEAVDGEEPEQWQALSVPDEWRSVEGFLQAVPSDLSDQWVIAAIHANPGLFSVGDAEKKRERLYVKSSMRRWNGS